MIIHDAELGRLAGRSGRIEDLALADVRKLRIRIGPSARPRGEPVPTLEELATVAGRKTLGNAAPTARLVVEIKVHGDAPGFVQDIVRILRRTGHRNAALISFSPSIVDRVHRVLRWPLTGLILGSGTPAAQVSRALRRPEPLIVLQKSLASAAVIAAAARRGKRVWIYAVDGRAEQSRMAARGVDGIITNFPDRLARTLRQRR